MGYTLIVDIGNSQIEIGVFKEDKIINKFRFETKKLPTAYENKLFYNFLSKIGIKPSEIDGGMIFSVVPHLTRLAQIILTGELGIELEVFDSKNFLKTFKTDVDDPSEIGHDLLADVVGAIHLYGAPIIICDLGTVTKNLIVDKDGVFRGVSFFPGVRLNTNTLSDMTAQLPELKEVTRPKSFYGKNTVDAMISGIYYCHVASTKRFMEKIEEIFGYEFKKVITGGYSNLFKPEYEEGKYIVDPEMVLKGMYLIYKNQK